MSAWWPDSAEDAVWTPEMVTFARRATDAGLPFAPRVALGTARGIPPDAVRRGRVALGAGGTLYIAPTARSVESVAQWTSRHPEIAARVAVAAPSELRRAMIAADAKEFAARAVDELDRHAPGLSARQVLWPRQIAVITFIFVACTLALIFDPIYAAAVIGFTATTFFLAVSIFRFTAASLLRQQGLPKAAPVPHTPDNELPVYTVLVPLFREAAVVRHVVAALRRLDWPSDRLDVKMILEEDDLETRAAVERHLPGPPFEAIVVPGIGPRTKPKALAFAHLFSRGEFVVIYDAEDDPDPRQLREAHARFAAEPELACVQAPLLIDNPDQSWIAKLFAIEYSALFDGLLPMLASMGLPMPLGGTSNHFRRSVLDEVGGWDPFNMTEDADLGLRLARCGHRVGTITLPTYEEAPIRFGAWMRQRTRWFKGWMQTCLVHTRQPLQLAADLGFKSTIGFVTIQLGMILSAMLHPIFLVALAVIAMQRGFVEASPPSWLVIFGVANLAAGYAAMIALASRTLALRGLSRIEPALVALPVYWLLMSVATYRALWDLVVRPHYWAKTTHFGVLASPKARSSNLDRAAEQRA